MTSQSPDAESPLEVPPSDLAEQQSPVHPEDASTPPVPSTSDREADAADLVEQLTEVPVDDEDYPAD